MIKTLIIENDLNAIDLLKTLIQETRSDIEISGIATSIKEGISLIIKVNPDIIFLDIELDDGLGFELLDVVDTTLFEVIFITAHDTYYKSALEHFAFSYLLKPFDLNTLQKSIDRYLNIRARYAKENKYVHFKEFLKETNTKILLPIGNKNISVAIDDIFSCHSDGNYTKIHLKDKKKLLVSHRLKHFEELFNQKGFFRANRQCLINTKHISYIYKKETVILINDEKIHVSTRNKSSLQHLINTLS